MFPEQSYLSRRRGARGRARAGTSGGGLSDRNHPKLGEMSLMVGEKKNFTFHHDRAAVSFVRDGRRHPDDGGWTEFVMATTHPPKKKKERNKGN